MLHCTKLGIMCREKGYVCFAPCSSSTRLRYGGRLGLKSLVTQNRGEDSGFDQRGHYFLLVSTEDEESIGLLLHLASLNEVKGKRERTLECFGRDESSVVEDISYANNSSGGTHIKWGNA